ncbi:MAG: methyltransferase domain-containing protein [Nanoarchaeota archaeon]|nr:methyltransferase domain-containing protein [Nanoarchaeota archaeon]
MKKKHILLLACPKCGCNLKLKIVKKQKEEIIEGSLFCKECKKSFEIKNGIPLVYHDSSVTDQHKVKEMFNETPYGLVGMRDALKNRNKISIRTINKSPWYIREDDVKGKLMLEAGCGGGHLYTELSLLGAEVIGLDQTPNSLLNIKKLHSEYGLSPQLVQGNIEFLPVKENSFDIVTSMGVIHHTPDTQKSLNNLARTVKRGGNIHLMLYHKNSVWNYVKNTLRFLCRRSKLFSKLIFKLTPLWMGETRSQSNAKTVFRDNMVNAITKSFSESELRRMAKKAGLRVEFVSKYEIVELYCFGKKVYQSPLLRWYEKRFGWFLYAKLKKI